MLSSRAWFDSMTSTPMLSFADVSRPLAARIEESLTGYLALDADCPPVLCDAMRHVLLGPGKRLRPLLVLMAAEACGGTISGGDARSLRGRDGPHVLPDPR